MWDVCGALRAVAVILLVVLVILLAWRLLRICAPALVVGGAQRARGGTKRRAEVQAAIKTDIGKLLRMPWEYPETGGEFAVFEAAVVKDKLQIKGAMGPPHRAPFLLIVRRPTRWDRNSPMTPNNIAAASRSTAMHQFAWVLFDAPEGRYAIRRDGAIPETQIVSQMRAALQGDPPHKMAPAALVGILKQNGFEAIHAPGDEAEARFQPFVFQTDAELEQERQSLYRMDQKAFDALDWSDVDTKLVPLLDDTRERSGQLGIADGRVVVLKIREGGPGHAVSSRRAPIEYHTHPRRSPGFVEQPSGTDLLGSVYEAANGVVWSVIVAPEGCYIYAPTDAIIKLDQKKLQEMIGSYERMRCGEPPLACLRDVLASLRRIGFTTFFRPNPDWAAAAATMPPFYNWNDVDTEKYWAAHAQLSSMPGRALLDYDWTELLKTFSATVAIGSSWVPVDLDKKRLVPQPGGFSTDPFHPSYWTDPGTPLVAIYHPDGQTFTKAELNAFRRARRDDTLVAAILVTRSDLYVLTDPERAAQELPTIGPDPPRAETIREYGFTLDTKTR